MNPMNELAPFGLPAQALPTEPSLRSQLLMLVGQESEQITGVAQAFDQALDEYRERAIAAPAAPADTRAVYDAMFAFATRLLHLHLQELHAQLTDKALQRVVVLTPRYSDDTESDYRIRIARHAITSALAASPAAEAAAA